MGIMNFLGKQFIDVIEWSDQQNDVLMYRYPMQDQEIQNGAQLTVRATQAALFVNEGLVADQFGEGLHTLNTRTLPILTNIKNWDKAFASPFKSDLYFFSTRLQLDQKWGTPTAITIRDKEFGVLRIRAYGIFSYRIQDPKVFYMQVAGNRELCTTGDLDGQLKGTIASSIASFLGTAEVPFIDMAANQLLFGEKLGSALKPVFEKYGLGLDTFQVQSVSLPEELEKRLDERASVGIVGDLKKYAQFQAAKSIPLAAENQGGVAGAGAGIGAGVAMGQAMMQAFGSAGGGGGAPEESPLATIEKLHDLFKKGVISEAEFLAKKNELLSKI